MREVSSNHIGDQFSISRYWFFIPLAIGILIMLPRICSPEFGFFDDAGLLIKSHKLINGEWDQLLELGSGRFRPFYWIFPMLIYSIAKMRPEWFFIGNLILLVGTTALVIILANRLTGSRFIALLSGIFFVTSGPIIESYYTLSKGEPLQAAWILVSLLALYGINQSKSRKFKSAVLGLIILSIFLAIISKETSLAMLPISMIWFIGALIRKYFSKTETDWKISAVYLSSTVIAAGIYFILRTIMLPDITLENGYTSNYIFDIPRLIAAMKQWERWIRRDFFYLAPLCVIPIINLIRTRRVKHAKILFNTLVWMIGWTIIFLPWVYQVEYYLLPFSVGSSVLGGILLEQTVMSAKCGGILNRLLTTSCAVVATILFTVTIPNNLTNARLQLTVDENNAAMLSYIVDELPSQSTLLINIQEPNQYADDIKLWLSEIMGRSDLLVENYNYQTFTSSNAQYPYFYIASPYLDNQYYRSVRLGVSEASSKKWDESMLSFVGESAKIIYETYGEFRLSIVDIRFGCLFMDAPDYCDIPTVPFDNRVLTYGGQVLDLL